MSQLSARGLGGVAQRLAQCRPWRSLLKAAVVANASPRRGRPKTGALCGGWLVNRIVCAVMGHRLLVGTAATPKVLRSGVRRELCLCHACDSYAWQTTSTNHGFSWNDVGV